MTDHMQIPQATRVFPPMEHEDSSDETVWYNPTEKDAILDLYVATPQMRVAGRRVVPPRNWEEKTGMRRYVIKAKTMRTLPSDFDRAIQQTQCKEVECLGRAFDCKAHDHHKEIVGGLGTQLLNKGTLRNRTTPPHTLSSSLDDVAAREKALKLQRFQEFEKGEQANAALQASQRELAELNRQIEEKRMQLAAAKDIDVPVDVKSAGKGGRAKGVPGVPTTDDKTPTE